MGVPRTFRWAALGALILALTAGISDSRALAGGDGDPAAGVATQDATGSDTTAAKGRGDPIGVLEVATYGVSQTAGDKFEQSVEETLAGVGFRAVRSQVVKKQLARGNYVVGCTFGPCMREVLRATGLRRVLVAHIQGAGQSYSVVVSLVDTRDGTLISQVAQSCPVCTVEEAISTATLAVVELITGAHAPGEKSAVPGAALAGSGPAADLTRKQRQVRRVGWLFLATGVVAGAVGGYLLATDHADAGGPTAGAGGALAVTGLTTLILSTTF